MLYCCPADGGVGVLSRHIIDEMRKNGIDEMRKQGTTVTSIALAAGPIPAKVALRQLWRMKHELRHTGNVIVEFGKNDTSVFWFALGCSLLRRDVVVVAHDAPLIAKSPGAGIIRTAAGWRDIVAYRLLSPLLDRGLRAFLRRRAGALALLSQQARSDLGSPPNCVVIDHGADPPVSTQPPSDGENIVFAGYLSPGKGLDTLCQAWRRIENPTLPLAIAGELSGRQYDQWLKNLQQQFATTPLPPQWMGKLEDEDFSTLIANAAIVVLPYETSNPASGVLVRAMVEGRAVVATDVPAVKAVITNNHDGIVVPVGDDAALAAAIGRLMNDTALRNKLGKNAAALAAERFTWARHLEGLERARALASENRR